jgi:predicted metal-binding membrane protein
VIAGSWAVTTVRMQGMGMGSRTDLGAFGWFAGVWATMMAAMMLPSLAPLALSKLRAGQGPWGRAAPLLFAFGYLLVWSAVGVVAYLVTDALRPVAPGWLSRGDGGNLFAAAVLLGAAAYELTAVKASCLRRCRDGSPPVRPRLGAIAPLVNGVEHGGYCLGCCGALMVALFALGVMSITWMVLLAVVVAVQKLLPWGDASRAAAALMLTALALGTIV